jgi:hypothetical protein
MSILMDVTEHKSAGDEEMARQLARKVREVLAPAGPRGNLRHDPR